LEQRIKNRYNGAIYSEALERYGIAADRIQLLDGFESYIYEFQRDSQAYILRIGHSFRRSPELIFGEVDWINYLAEGGASVASAVTSRCGNLVEQLDDGNGERFLATAFVKARGRPPSGDDWSPRLIERYGGLLGRMHALSKRYEPPHAAWRRPAWDAPDMLEVERILPAAEVAVLDRFRELMEHLERLPKDRETYGLIHQDAHGGYFFVDESGQITLFDFDDCAYSWYMNDIAIVLFYAVMWEKDAGRFTQAFMTHFLRGYTRENRLDPAWLAKVPHFLKLREIDLYAVIHSSFDVENLDDPWCAGYMRGRKQRIENGVPYVDYEFEALAGCLTRDP